jgi:lantibiotic modifying enzyme
MEIALVAGRLLDDPDCRTRAARIAETLIDRLDPEGSGDHRIVPIGSRPALMVGLAGVGHALLRLHSPERVPSVLLVD